MNPCAHCPRTGAPYTYSGPSSLPALSVINRCRAECYNTIGWVPPGSKIASLRHLKSIQSRLNVCLYLALPFMVAYENRFLGFKYKEAVWGDGGNGEYWRSYAYFLADCLVRYSSDYLTCRNITGTTRISIRN
ncbi:hypothetical protein F4813DRAFT_358605 [Daldinia decipiens]|uniref:uncharacterized protein n=1 Tax=Daldinia decipiens TaxID=326647 RepID=UPI0020C42477|nr:uncharacterized protein F4813DRAFT_358605 [Daldinia decipiens]KAI1657972.1 hypothetical protein F4813DRAFT_358605 [Daldinia decipiens]